MEKVIGSSPMRTTISSSRSSVGLECHFDIVEVEGSIPSVKTIFVENSLYLGLDVLYNCLCHL